MEYKLASEPTVWTTFADGTSTSTSVLITGLSNSLSYNFRVSAVNSIGTGPVSSTTTAVPNLNVPTAPQSLVASILNKQSTLSWSAPLSNGGASITDYVVEYKLSTEPTTWTTFPDGTSATTGATVTGLTNGSLYNFRVSAVNSIGAGAFSNIASVTPLPVKLSDNFTGTTIDSSKWVEVDPAGLGGTIGSVTQNNSLSIVPTTAAWATQNGVKTVSTYDRTNGDVSMEFNVTRSSCGSNLPLAVGYGDMNITANPSASYILLANTTTWSFYYWLNGANNAASGSPQTLSGLTSCTNGVPITFKIVALQSGGAKVYVNGSVVESATLTGGTFTNKTFWIGSGLTAGGTVTYDDVLITEPFTGPLAPVGLSGLDQDNQITLSWVSGGNNGYSITDYIVEYKLNTSQSWTTFPDGTSATTGATVTGLTNGSLYNFRVSAVNINGTSSVSSIVNAMPFSSTPIVPEARSVAISGSASQGESIRGTYLFYDANGDTEATSTYRWLRSDTVGGLYSAIANATNINYTLTSNDLNKYIKFEVTPVSKTSPTTGSSVLSSASSLVVQADYINQIISTGQSLSVGIAGSPALTTTQPYSNLMLSGGNGGLGLGTSFIPLIESSLETISSSMANTITANYSGFNVAVSLHGVSGYTYSQLKKGTVPYANGITQVTNSKNAANLLGRVSRVIGLTAIHGETDNKNGVDGTTYKGYLEEWQNDYQTDVEAITGQTGYIPMFTDQMDSFTSSYSNMATSTIPIAQLAASEDNPGKIYLVTPKYFLNYSDVHHLTASSYRWLGEYYGKVIKKVAIDHEAWRPLSPDTIVRNGNVIYAKFHVPAGSLAIDTTMVSPRTNYGFEYYDSSSSASISSVEILNPDTVKITLSGSPTGSNQRLRYAYTGTPGTNPGPQNTGSVAGNLRDTDTYSSLYGNTLYDWAVHFDKVIIEDSTSPLTPVSTPLAGIYNSIQSLSLTSSGSNTIRYSSVGIPATCSSDQEYTGPISISTSQTIYVKACDLANNYSTASFVFTIDNTLPENIVAVPAAGIYTSAQSLVLSSAGSDYIKYDTTSLPLTCSDGNLYSVPISILTSQTIYARACDNVGNSTSSSFAYTISSSITHSSSGFMPIRIVQTKQTPNTSISVPTKNYNFGTNILKNGSKGQSVKDLQSFLNNALNINLAIDGKMGTKTVSFVKKWQKANGLKPDGILGQKTKEKIKLLSL